MLTLELKLTMEALQAGSGLLDAGVRASGLRALQDPHGAEFVMALQAASCVAIEKQQDDEAEKKDDA